MNVYLADFLTMNLPTLFQNGVGRGKGYKSYSVYAGSQNGAKKNNKRGKYI